MDEDYCVRNVIKNRNSKKADVEDFYEWEAHVFFDDSITTTELEGKTEVNEYAIGLINTVHEYGTEWYKRIGVQFSEPTKMLTPYGGRLDWILPGETLLVIHLKDKNKIRNRKR